MSQAVSSNTGNGLLTGVRISATVLALGVLTQAWLGSSGFFQGAPGRIDVHAMLGNFLFLIAVVQAGLCLVAMQKGITSRMLLYLAAATVLLTTGQIGLGYSTRNSIDALAWHLPVGVALMGLTTVIAVLAYQTRASDD